MDGTIFAPFRAGTASITGTHATRAPGHQTQTPNRALCKGSCKVQEGRTGLYHRGISVPDKPRQPEKTMKRYVRKFEVVVPEWGSDRDAGSFDTKAEAVTAALDMETSCSKQIYCMTYIYLPFGWLIQRCVRLTDWTVAA